MSTNTTGGSSGGTASQDTGTTAGNTSQDISPADEALLSAPHTAKGCMQRECLSLLRVHVREGTIPTNIRFIFYELETLGIVTKVPRKVKPGCTTVRRNDQEVSDAVTHLRESGVISWDWIDDETRTYTAWQTAPSAADFALDAARRALLNPWTDRPPPLILCESRSVRGALLPLAMEYRVPIAATNGQARGFLITKVAPRLEIGQPIGYVGDRDDPADQIEEHSKRILTEHSAVGEQYLGEGSLWERLALTEEQVAEHNLPVIIKKDRRYRPAKEYEAVEAEALGQKFIVDLVRAWLDELIPEPIKRVRERERAQRAEVVEALAQVREERGW